MKVSHCLKDLLDVIALTAQIFQRRLQCLEICEAAWNLSLTFLELGCKEDRKVKNRRQPRETSTLNLCLEENKHTIRT